MRSRRYKKKGPVRSKKVVHDGITFQSGLEKYMYIALKEDQMNLFQYVGNYLKSTLQKIYLTLRYINLKIKKNATKP